MIQKRQLPFALTTMRLLLGPIALCSAQIGISRWVYLPILVAGTLSDIYDGVLARRYGVATPFLRRYDSASDLIFYLFILVTAWRLRHDVLKSSWWAIALVLIAEAALIIISVHRFGRYPAAHTTLAKCFGVVLLTCLVALLTFNAGTWAVYTIGLLGVATNAEIIAIHLVAASAPVDVKSLRELLNKKRAAHPAAL